MVVAILVLVSICVLFSLLAFAMFWVIVCGYLEEIKTKNYNNLRKALEQAETYDIARELEDRIKDSKKLDPGVRCKLKEIINLSAEQGG